MRRPAQKEKTVTNPLELWRGARRNPFRDLTRMETAFDRMFDNFPEVTARTGENRFTFAPSCEVSEENNHYTLKFDLPGIPKDQVKIELADNRLTVSAERKEETRKDTKKVHLEELSYGSYMRTFTLPSAVDEKKVDAKYDNGVLTITIPKMESAKAKQIEVH